MVVDRPVEVVFSLVTLSLHLVISAVVLSETRVRKHRIKVDEVTGMTPVICAAILFEKGFLVARSTYRAVAFLD